MKSSLIPISCSLVLATLSGAALSHWWSLREFASTLTAPPARPTAHAPLNTCPPPALPSLPSSTALVASQAVPPAKPAAAQKEFFELLLDEMKQLKQTNLTLRDQMAETNRDLMQLEFRVDTQSASFRPLPVTENLSILDTSSLDTSDPNPTFAVSY